MDFDLERARAETPGCARVLHFNNAGAGLMPQPVLDAVVAHLEREASMGGYEAADAAHDAVEHVYDAAASLINARSDEIAVVENATRAWDMAFYSVPLGPGDRILTAMAEYASNYIAYLQVAARTGAVIEVIPNDETGQLSVDALRADDRRPRETDRHHPCADERRPRQSGGGGRAGGAGGGHPLSARCLPVRRAVAGGCGGDRLRHALRDGAKVPARPARHRLPLRPPRAAGAARYRPSSISMPPPGSRADRYEIRPDARRFENWETNYATKIGLGVAIDYARSWGIETTWAAHPRRSRRCSRARLGAMPGVTVRDIGAEQCGIVTFTTEGREPAQMVDKLLAQGINVSFTTVNGTRLDMEARGLTAMVRASVHYYNSEDEIERFCAALAGLPTP